MNAGVNLRRGRKNESPSSSPSKRLRSNSYAGFSSGFSSGGSGAGFSEGLTLEAASSQARIFPTQEA